MSRVRVALLVVLAAALLITAIVTWGSLGSAVLVFCLIMGSAGVLYQRFLTHRDEDDFQFE